MFPNSAGQRLPNANDYRFQNEWIFGVIFSVKGKIFFGLCVVLIGMAVRQALVIIEETLLLLLAMLLLNQVQFLCDNHWFRFSCRPSSSQVRDNLKLSGFKLRHNTS